jgi:two-component system NtrC family sensor kinase
MIEQGKILFVDDEANVLRSLQRLFMDENYELFTASSGKKGLETLREEQGIQVVVSDYRMPEMSGVDFLKEVYEYWPDTVRIVLSGYADTGSIVGAINEGQIYRFIPKPWNDDELKIHIAKAFEIYFLRMKNLKLAAKLEESNEELKLINENLEERVRERTEEVLFQNVVLEKSQNILNALPVGVVGIDDSGLIVQCNNKAGALFNNDNWSITTNNYKKAFSEPLVAFIDGLDGKKNDSQSIAIGDKKHMVMGVVMDTQEGQKGKIIVLVPET